MSYAICFDFPEAPDPLFAWRGEEGLGWTGSLADAIRFDTEADAQRTLANGYGPSREFGAVVEVEA